MDLPHRIQKNKIKKYKNKMCSPIKHRHSNNNGKYNNNSNSNNNKRNC